MKLLLWTVALGLLFGLIGFGQLAEDMMRIARNRLHPHPASGEIVLIKIDDPSLREVGRWPWARRNHAALIDRLTNAGVREIHFDIVFEVKSDPADDRLLAESMRRSNRVILPIRGSADAGKVKLHGPLTELRKHARLSLVRVDYNYQNAVWHLPLAEPFEGKLLPSMAVRLAGQTKAGTARFPIDYSIDTRSIPSLSAADVLYGRAPPNLLRGKKVVIAADSGFIGDRYFIPGVGQMAGANVQILGAETLKAGTPLSIGWLLPFILACGVAAMAALRKDRRFHGLILGSSAIIWGLGPAPLEANLVFVDVAPALFVTLTVWVGLIWRRYKNDGLINPVSGLPNLAALKVNRQGREQALVVARVLNYAEVAASLPAEAERALVEQIVNRLTVGASEKMAYHGDGGIFAWFEEPRLPFGNHVDALHALFRTPVRVGNQPIDLSVTFGVEVGSGRSLANRLASALLAAEEAAHDGLKWKIHDPEKLNDSSWKLSLLSRLDQAIDTGEVWVAYQPKLDLRTREVIGAEALARWTHPEKGPIAAAEFIPAAEQHDRIEKLTDFVLDQAIGCAAAINASGRTFHIAVNLSARLLGDKALQSRISALLLKHLLEPELLTLELTETSAITSAEALQVLSDLRALGVHISIDDYGTGLSTLDYLKKVPASELKIDQSFVRGVIDSRSDRVMVQSTIALAHSLGRVVVAEGVESKDVLDALIEMKCDIAQGFIIGRPMSFESLRKRLSIGRKRSVA